MLTCLPQQPATAAEFVPTDRDAALPPPSSGTLWFALGVVTTNRQGRLSSSDVQGIGDYLLGEAATAADQC